MSHFFSHFQFLHFAKCESKATLPISHSATTQYISNTHPRSGPLNWWSEYNAGSINVRVKSFLFGLTGMPHSGEEVQDLPFRDDVSHGSIVMEFMGFFNGQPLCHLRFEAFFLGPRESHAPAWLFVVVFLLLRLFHWLWKPESCTVLEFTWWWPERISPVKKYVEFNDKNNNNNVKKWLFKHVLLLPPPSP